MSDDDENEGGNSGGYTPPVLLPPTDASVAAPSTATSTDSAAAPATGTPTTAASSPVRASPPPLTSTSTPTATPTSTGDGLFAGLSLSAGSSPVKSPRANTPSAASVSCNSDAAPSSQAPGSDNGNDCPGADLSRAGTPITSNVSEPPSPAASPPKTEPSPPRVRPSPRSPGVTLSGPITASTRKSPSGNKERGAENSGTDVNAPGSSGDSPATLNAVSSVSWAGPWLAHPPTSRIPHPDTCLRLLRKFYAKSSPTIPQAAGGTKPGSWFGWVFGSSAETAGNTDPSLSVFHEFSKALKAGDGDDDDDSSQDTNGKNQTQTQGDNQAIVESILGHKGDSLAKARRAISAFAQLVSVWCRASAHAAALLEESGADSNVQGVGVVTAELLALAIDAASGLVAHGCFDDLYLKFGGSVDGNSDSSAEIAEGLVDETTYTDKEATSGAPSLTEKAVNVLAESIFVADLSSERTELSALKFLLTTGCRISSCSTNGATSTDGSEGDNGAPSLPPPMEPMLRGTHLLQTIRVCYHIYLKTGSMPNKTTAKAALQQLVASVFVRLERSIERIRLQDKMIQTDIGRASAHSSLHGDGAQAKASKQIKQGSMAESASAGAGNEKTNLQSGTALSGAATFPTQDHKDAYLVLRSLCKLSMQTRTHSTVPATVSGPLDARPGGAPSNGTTSAVATTSPATESTSVPMTASAPPSSVTPAAAVASNHADGAEDPALESRVFALELLLHILRHPAGPCLLHAGPQFHYAIRQYLCVSLLKNTTSPDTAIVELSLRLFVPLIQHFRSLLKTEIEAFVTNVFFVILDSKNSTVQHKLLVVTLFEEICSDAATLAEIFLNYDCDLSAVDLFQRIVNALGKVARVGLTDATGSGTTSSLQFVAGAGALRAEKTRQDHRELRLAAMKALRQVLASLHSSIVTPVKGGENGDISVDEASLQLKLLVLNGIGDNQVFTEGNSSNIDAATDEINSVPPTPTDATTKKTLVEMYDSKKKRREEESQAALKFNQKPTLGLKYAADCGHLDADDPVDVARYLLQNKDIFDKAQIGEYLGREKEWKDGFALKVLRAYGDALDFRGMKFDDAIRYYLSGFRLPGEAQKIDRIMEVFAARYTEQNSGTFPTADSAFILAFSIIMLNTDLHNPAIKEERKMTTESFIRMNSGVCDGGDFPNEMLVDIFNRIKTDPISLKEDDDARESAGISTGGGKKPSALSTAGLSASYFFGSHYVELDKTRETNYQKEGDQIIRDTESMLRRRRKATKHSSGKHNGGKANRETFKLTASVKFVGTADSGLRDEYVTPMFDVTWGPALAVFSTAIESANGTDGILASIATDDEMDLAVGNATSAIEICLNGFQLAICIAALCGNNTARDAYVRALYNFTLLGTGRLLGDRHIQCVQSLLRLGRDDGELLGVTWEHIFRAQSEISRLHQVWEGMARNERAAQAQHRKRTRAASRAAGQTEENERTDDDSENMDDVESYSDSDDSDFYLEDEMDKRMIDEANALSVHEMVPVSLIDSIFHRSSSLSRQSLREFVYQLCRVSRMEISGYGGHVGSDANDVDLTNDHYMKHHTLPPDSKQDSQGLGAGVVGNQPAIYSLQKLVEVTHYNMESRPRLIFADIWGTISTHLASTALHENAAVAMYAVDSLRQLSIRFLNREELGVFEFQRRFLKPLETIMTRSSHVSVKELLLSSVEQLILIYGFNDSGSSFDGSVSSAQHKRRHRGTLRSGWRSVLTVFGFAGCDKDDSIASMGFKLLSTQIQHCMSVSLADSAGGTDGIDIMQPDILLSEYFVDLVNALLLYVSGPRQDLSTKSIDSLLQLANLLAEGKVPLSSTRRKASVKCGNIPGNGPDASVDGNDGLELWWPMLLGLSKTMGDRRQDVRVKGLGTLLDIINKHFFPSDNKPNVEGQVTCDGDSNDFSPQHGDLQTLQLIFRGILVPALEFEEMDGNSTTGSAPELLPAKFVHFITIPPAPNTMRASHGENHEWITTTFEHLMDGCISICLRSLKAFNSDSLVEEVLAMINSCLLSDSGHLAVKGLRRLQQFITKDLELKDVTDDTWATVSHMLFRVLSVRGLPPSSPPESQDQNDEKKEQQSQSQIEMMNDFIREQKFLSNRRYIGCNAAMVIGSLLTNDTIVNSMGLHWCLFLTSGLGKGIKDWEKAAEIMDSRSSSRAAKSTAVSSPPHYLENVLYARRWMTKFLLNLMIQNDATTLETSPCQNVLKEETISILQSFLRKEADASCSTVDMRNISKMVTDLLDCFNALNDEKLSKMKWLSSVLSTCIQTNNVTIRTSVQILFTRALKVATPTAAVNANVENVKQAPLHSSEETS